MVKRAIEVKSGSGPRRLSANTTLLLLALIHGHDVETDSADVTPHEAAMAARRRTQVLSWMLN